MTEEKKLNELWKSLDGVPRTGGVPDGDDERRREDRLLDEIKRYVADQDYWDGIGGTDGSV